MKIGNVSQVLNRINEIETRFNFTEETNEKTFTSILKKETETPNGSKIQDNKQVREIKGMLSEAAKKYGIDEKLVDNLAKTESNYRADAVSSAGAVGVMQLMPTTAKEMGVNNAYDPQENIDGGVKYLKNLLVKYNNTEQAVAAYNAGMGAVDKYGGVPPYEETKEYVAKVLSKN